ncbi:hypothetical protein ALP29_201380 [Pseudomonas syringae pv. avii]|uniref:Uncharacterized protein n=1 Tax=Pseudomonas syringae pv. avii TaxID=663959 RepID=A0A3M5VLC3_PSESX|nr:hypothetical protein ALP29_201380 [Pseudomonas syringae pv. avii]
MLARIDQQAAGQQQGSGATRRDQNSLRIDIELVALGVEPGNRFAQLWQAASGGIAGLAVCQRRLSCLDDRLCGSEVGLANFKVNDIMTRRLQLIGTRQQRHDMKGFDGATASAVGLGHGYSFIGASIKNMIVMTTTHDST